MTGGMLDDFSPAARHALRSTSRSGETDLVALLAALTAQPQHGASRCLGQIGIPPADAQRAISSLAPMTAPTRGIVHELTVLLGELGCPATSGGVMCACLSARSPLLAETAGRLRRTFWILAGDIADSARRVARDALADLEALLAQRVGVAGGACAERRPGVGRSPPSSVGLRRVMNQAAQVARGRDESQIDSSALMTAAAAWHLTADDRDVLLALGLAPIVLGMHAARPSRESGANAVQLACDPSRTYSVTDVAAEVMSRAGQLAVASHAHAIHGQTLLIAQLATEASCLASLVRGRLPGGLTAVERYAHAARPAGLAPAELELAMSLSSPDRSVPDAPADDFTDLLVLHALKQTLYAERPCNLSRLHGVLPAGQRTLVARFAALIAHRGASTESLDPEDAALFGGAVGYVESVAVEHCINGTAPAERWGALSRLAGLPAVEGPPGAAADAAALQRMLGGAAAPPENPLLARLAFKSDLQARQSEGAAQQRWAAGVGGSWERLAIELAGERRWKPAAEAIVRAARASAATSPTGRLSGRRTPVLPAPAFAADDLSRWERPTLFVACDHDESVAICLLPGGRWDGSLRAQPPAMLDAWWRHWRDASGRHVEPALRELAEAFDIDASWLDADLHVVSSGQARALPWAQTAVAMGAPTIPITHLLGGIGPHTVTPPKRDELRDACVVYPPPSGGFELPAGIIEARVVSALARPGTVLSGERAARAWLQRAMTAMRNVPTPDLLHFVGHGTFGELPDGRFAASVVLADEELFTPDDLRAVDAAARVVVCSACDVAVAAPGGGPALDPWPLAALLSGCEWVLAAAWPIVDIATALMMTDLYRRWVGDSAPDLARALTASSRWLRAAERPALRARLKELGGDPALATALGNALDDAGYGETPFSTAGYHAAFGLYCA